MKREKILLISHNFSPEPTGIGKYNGEMIEWLAKHGYDCTVITTYPYYPHWKVQKPYKNRWFKKEVFHYPDSGASITIYRCPSYIPANPTGKKRMIQDLSFWTSKSWIILKVLLSSQKFDLIITVAPPFHLAYLGLFFRDRRGGKILYHIQDLQIDAAQDLNMIANKRVIDKLYAVEQDILSKVDFISTISEGMMNKVRAKIDKEVLFFPNWADTSFFYPVADKGALKQAWGYKQDDIVFLYSGAIGEKQGLENVIYAAEMLKDDEKIKFIICGSGPYKHQLLNLATEKKLNNVAFLPVQEKNDFNNFLNMADFHLVLQRAHAGDLVMPSKLTTILAVGGASIVTCLPGTSLHDVVEKYDVGYIIEPDSYIQLAQAINQIRTDQQQAETKRNNARNYALQYLNIDNIMKAFVDKVLSPELVLN